MSAGTLYTDIFNFHRWKSVKSYICGLGRFNLAFYFKDMRHEILLSFISYYK